MARQLIQDMAFCKVYGCLVAKAQRKGRTQEEVDALVSWLLGYSSEDIASLLERDVTYGSFFDHAPCWNERAKLIHGSVCGIKVETIEDPFLWRVRCLDKLVDDLAKGKPMEKILP